MKTCTEPDPLIEAYIRRKELRTLLLSTHHPASYAMRKPLRFNLSEQAKQQRAALWPALDRINAEISRLKEKNNSVDNF